MCQTPWVVLKRVLPIELKCKAQHCVVVGVTTGTCTMYSLLNYGACGRLNTASDGRTNAAGERLEYAPVNDYEPTNERQKLVI